MLEKSLKMSLRERDALGKRMTEDEIVVESLMTCGLVSL